MNVPQLVDMVYEGIAMIINDNEIYYDEKNNIYEFWNKKSGFIYFSKNQLIQYLNDNTTTLSYQILK